MKKGVLFVLSILLCGVVLWGSLYSPAPAMASTDESVTTARAVGVLNADGSAMWRRTGSSEEAGSESVLEESSVSEPEVSSEGSSVSEPEASSEESSVSEAEGSSSSDVEESSSEASSEAESEVSSVDESSSGSDVSEPEEPEIIVPAEIIILAEGQTLVLGADAKYLLRNDAGAAEEILAEEWETPTGLYDEGTTVTSVEDANNVYVRSVVPAVLAGIKGPVAGALRIVDGSDITVRAAGDFAVEAYQLFIGSDATEIETLLHADAALVGIGVKNSLNSGKNTKVWASGTQNAIAYIGGPDDYYGDVTLYMGSEFELTATGENGVALYVGTLSMIGSVINAHAANGVGGVKITQWLSMSEESGKRSTIRATSDRGRAFSCDSGNMQSSDISGVTANGNIGIHMNSYLSMAIQEEGSLPSNLYGKANSGFGVVVQSIDGGDQEFPSGSLSLNGGKIEGYVQDGMGFSTNYLHVNSVGEIEGELIGVAQRGIGISACMLNTSENTKIHGISRGESENHFQVYESIPDSAGINVLSYFNVSGNASIVGEAPMEIEGSYGIHSMLLYESGYVAGSINLSTYGTEEANITASGEVGMFASSIALRGNGTIDAQGSKDGLVAIEIRAEAGEAGSGFSVRARGKSGCGVKLYSEWGESYSNLQLVNVDLDAVGGEYGVFAELDYSAHIENSSVYAEANGQMAVAGVYMIGRQRQMQGVHAALFANSHLEAVSPRHGWLFKDMALTLDAGAYVLDRAPYFKGIGEEDGIKLEFSEEFAAQYVPEGEVALQGINMVLPSGEPYKIIGESRFMPPDVMGRSPAISVPSATIKNGGIIREEYWGVATRALSADYPYLVYAEGMNVDDYTEYEWTSPQIMVHAMPNGLVAEFPGMFKAEITARTIAPRENGKIWVLDDARHEILLLADANISTVTFNAQGGSPAPWPEYVPVGDVVREPQPVEKAGHVFTGWVYTETGNVWNFGSDKVEKEEMTLEAQWQAVPYSMLYDGNAEGDGSLSGMPQQNPIVLLAGELVPRPAQAPQRVGHKFLHWSENREGQITWDFDNMPMPPNDLVLYAVWEKDVYEVIYQGTGGLPDMQKENVPFGEAIPGSIEQPKREGFAFAGWYEDWETTVEWNPATTMPAGDITLYAKWVRVHSAVSFNLNGGDEAGKPDDMLIGAGESANITQFQPGGQKAPYYAGHFFLGWLNDAGNVAGDSFLMPGADVHLLAQWQAIPAATLPNNIVAYRNTRSKPEIEAKLVYTYKYSDMLGREQSLTAKYVWDDGILARGGVSDISVTFVANAGPSVHTHLVKVYVLNEASIVADNSKTFAFGYIIRMSGLEWSPVCVSELPDFESKTIKNLSVPTTFHLNGTNTRVSGIYTPSFSAVYIDYFGIVRNLSRNVTAVVLAKDGTIPGPDPGVSVPSGSEVISSLPGGSSGDSGASDGSASGGASSETGTGGSGSTSWVVPTTHAEYLELNKETLNTLLEKNVPVVSIGGTKIPLHNGGLYQVWGLANIVLTVLSLLGAALLLLVFLARRRQPQEATSSTLKKVFAIVAMALGAVMLFVFVLTQNTRYLMTLVDRWTPLMLFIVAVQLALCIALFYKEKYPKAGNRALAEGVDPAEDAGGEEG